ncbi:hypothetical protein Cs7R123_40480 [Catellatospora sp. TT07R-123]|uniref:hypothetical protein n=1 Tax=Catellatospora sp. TT07R-123 TaxID=2733863 RepID=UPI001B0947C3|nr:hypothetical protein [Catellatospora sp. TT07R-123]GHJ46706.1 hypothetical protein Cs7R123_40480 [Catellatospora sp. TT07R-123]
MGYPDRQSQPEGWGQVPYGAPNTRAGGWGDPDDRAVPRQRSAADRYGQPSYDDRDDRGFHTYVTHEAYEPYEDDRWPDNLAEHPPPEARTAHAPAPDQGPGERDYWSALLWATGWFAVPLLVLLGRALLLPGTPDPACLAVGLGGCESKRSAALGDLISSSPRWALALGGALAVAAVLRWASDTWRAATIGFCAAVVAGGAATVLLSIT